MQNAELDDSQVGIEMIRKNINNLRYADDTIVKAESEEELKNLLMRVKEESQRASLKLNIQKTQIMASSPMNSLQLEGEKWKQWQILFSLVPKSLQTVTAATKLKYIFSWEGKLWQTCVLCLVAQ